MPVATLLPAKSDVYLAVDANDAETALRIGVQVYKAFIQRLYKENPMVQGLRVEMAEPTARKDVANVFDCPGQLFAEIPDTLQTMAQKRPLDAWRDITRVTLRDITKPMDDIVRRSETFVAMSRFLRPDEGEDVAQAKDVGPKKKIAITVILAGKESAIEIPEGENLLDGCLDKAIEVKWDCKNGVCDTCRVKVHSGMEFLSEVTSGEENMLGDQIKQGYRLSCQVTVKGPVKIEQ